MRVKGHAINAHLGKSRGTRSRVQNGGDYSFSLLYYELDGLEGHPASSRAASRALLLASRTHPRNSRSILATVLVHNITFVTAR